MVNYTEKNPHPKLERVKDLKGYWWKCRECGNIGNSPAQCTKPGGKCCDWFGKWTYEKNATVNDLTKLLEDY